MVAIVNLTAWAGLDFSHLPGQVVEVDDDTAAARVEAGLATFVDPPAATSKSAKAQAKAEAKAQADADALAAAEAKAAADAALLA